ncbi:hypothetical protein DYB32_001411 [Aphanomyces invadans]|uniref:SAM domain-containing protein n=1 Tax=Aphanomyces invadans TaxID=157072 RepID=A0A418B6J2_9STRA|nr:hypothetical protein DYB32_001411 [Aphanomyces invadans]
MLCLGRACAHIWSHQHSKKGDLNAKAKQLLTQTLNTAEKGAFVAWLRAGHEVRQESKTFVCDLLEFLVAWPSCSLNEKAPKVATEAPPVAFNRDDDNLTLSPSAATVSKPQQLHVVPEHMVPSMARPRSMLDGASNVVQPKPVADKPRAPLFQQESSSSVKVPSSIQTIAPTSSVVATALDHHTDRDVEMERARAKLREQVAAAEALAMEKQLAEKREVENRLSTLRREQELRRKQWEDEDNERLRLLELEFLGHKAVRAQEQQLLSDACWQSDVQVEMEKHALEETLGMASQNPFTNSTAPAKDDDISSATAFEELLARSSVDDIVVENLVGPPRLTQITSMFEELEAEEQRKRKVGVLKVEEFEQVKKQLALAQAERDKAAKLAQVEAQKKLQDDMVVVIQCAVRRHLAQRELDKRRKARDGATIVRVARGAIARIRTRKVKAAKLLRIEYNESTVTIQRCYKGSKARRAYRQARRKKNALFIQRVYRGYRGRMRVRDIRASYAHLQVLHANATKVQATYKMHREKDKYLGARVRTLAANEIQRVVRGHLARTKVSKMKEWERAEPGPEKLSLGLQRIEESKAEFERQQQEIDALHRAQEQAELKVSEIHSSLTESQKELAVLERELLEIDQIETDLHELTHEAEMLRTRGVDNTVPLGNGIALNQPNETGGFETKEEARKRQAEAYAIEMAIHIKRTEREKKKKELEAEFTSVFNDVQAKKHALEEMESKLSDMEAARMRKDREFTRLQRNLMELLEEQKYELDMIREKGIELETATATSAAAAAATAMKAKEHEKKSQAIFESTEELMKFHSLNMLKSLRDINADTTAAAVSSTAETAATAAAAAAAANIPTMKRLQVGSAELLDAASKKKKAELEEKKQREHEAHEALKQPFPNAMRDWSIDDVLRWLDVLSLSQYKQAFKEGAVDGALLLELRPEDLSDILGVTHKAHILKLLVSRKKYLPLTAHEQMKVSAVEREDASDNSRKGVPDMDTAFSQARNGRLKRLIESVEAGFDVHTEDDKGNTLLLIAAQNVNHKMVEFLIVKGSNVNHKNAQGNTALHFAMAYDKEGVLGEYLIGHGADDTIENMFGLSPYDGISADG